MSVFVITFGRIALRLPESPGKCLRAWGQNVRGQGGSPIFLPGHRKIETVPDVLSPGC